MSQLAAWGQLSSPVQSASGSNMYTVFPVLLMFTLSSSKQGIVVGSIQVMYSNWWQWDNEPCTLYFRNAVLIISYGLRCFTKSCAFLFFYSCSISPPFFFFCINNLKVLYFLIFNEIFVAYIYRVEDALAVFHSNACLLHNMYMQQKGQYHSTQLFIVPSGSKVEL